MLVAISALIGMGAVSHCQVQTTTGHLSPPPGRGYLHPACAYATNPDAPGLGDLVMVIWESDGSDSSYGVPIVRSRDNAESWGEPEYLEKFIQVGDDRIKFGPSSLFADPDNGTMVFFAQQAYYEDNQLTSTFKKRRIIYRISRDNGHTWSDRINLIQSGADLAGKPFDETHWMQGAVWGRNMSSTIGAKAVKIRSEGPNKGKILLPFQQQVVKGDGSLLMPAWGGFYASGCLIGTWNEQATALSWDCGTMVTVSPKLSSRGVFEPTVAELSDGRIIMIMRGSNSGLKGVTGCRFISVSEDQGLTWSAPVPLLYDDISVVRSSSSYSVLIGLADGKVYFCAVLTDQTPDGNWPRYPVCLAQIDPETLTVVKRSVLKVADRRDGDTDQVQYTCHWAYEDPHRQALIVLTPHIRGSIAGTAVDRHVVPLKLP